MCEPTLLTPDASNIAKAAIFAASANESNQRTRNGGFATSVIQLLLVAFISVSVMEFASWLPFNIPGVASAALATYVPAWYQYDEVLTKFDNTAWTYGTDYALTAIMSVLAILCLLERSPDNSPRKDAASFKLRIYSASLLVCYGASTLAGGWAHQHFTTVDSLNTTKFWAMWCVCVGNVAFASCYMGLIGREVQRYFGVPGAIPLGPWWFWPVFGTYMAAACALGYISFKRPACDIFIAGITQFPSTFYLMATLGLRRWPKSSTSKESPIDLVRLSYRIMFYVGFIGNAPLLPMYPLLVQYSGMTMAGINTLLHSWLMIMWGMQGISLLHLCKAMSSYELKESRD